MYLKVLLIMPLDITMYYCAFFASSHLLSVTEFFSCETN